MPDDLWPNFGALEKFRAPAAILREQASLLAEKTNGVILGEVTPVKHKEDSRLGFAFNLVAPALNNYRLRVLNLAHDVTRLYPARMAALLMPLREDGKAQIFQADNEAALLEHLRNILGHETTMNAIQSLWVQSEGFPAEPEEDIPF